MKLPVSECLANGISWPEAPVSRTQKAALRGGFGFVFATLQ